MNVLDSVEISGLWGSSAKPIKISFDRHFNFLIGPNGTGKTTVINLIAAALKADFETLDKIEFSTLSISLAKPRGRIKPRIDIVKTVKKGVPYYDIEYQIRNKATDKPTKFDLDALAEERAFRGLPPRMLRERHVKQRYLDVQKHLESLVTVCWLSIHRQTSEEQAPHERGYKSTIDRKLDSLTYELAKYFFELSQSYSLKTREFQKRSFLSMLTAEQENVLVGLSNELDVEAEKQALSKVFELLEVAPSEYEKKLQVHFQQFEDSRRKYSQEGKMSAREFSAIYNVWKSHSLVQYYKELESARREIYSPRETFISVVNEMLHGRKILAIPAGNEIRVATSQGRPIPLEELSSGEKQLLIILGEALLQRFANVIYIADEPELSLHVAWQEQLTRAITKLNPNAQIVFATHSPDIVSVNLDKVIEMEDLVQ